MEYPTLQFEDDGFDINISVENPEIKGDAIKHVVYTLKGEDKLSEINVIRRFSDFDKIRDILVARWPGCYVPSLPEKKMVGNLDAAFVQQRRVGLTFFLTALKKLKHLWYSDEVQLLLKNPSQDLQKAISAFSKTSSSEIILKYTQKFPQIRQKVIGPDSIAKINLFSQYLKKVQPVLQNLIDMTKNNLATRKKYNQQTQALLTYLLPEYQKNCLKQYLPQASQQYFAFYGQKDQQIQEQIANLKLTNSKTDIDMVYHGLKLQKRQVQAFAEALKVREDFHSQYTKSKQKLADLQEQKTKISSGKTTFSSLMSTKSKDQILHQLQSDISNAQKERNNLLAIYDIASGLLTLIQIDRFKKERQQSYYDLVKKSSEFQLTIAKGENDLWKAVLKSDAMTKADPS